MTCLKVTHFWNFLEILKKYENNLLRVYWSRVHKIRFIHCPSRNIQTDRKTLSSLEFFLLGSIRFLELVQIGIYSVYFSMSQGHLFVSLLFWGLHFIFYRDFSLSVLLVKTSFWNSSRMLKLMIFWYQKFSEKSVQKVTCLKVTHFWEFGRTQNASLFSTTV